MIATYTFDSEKPDDMLDKAMFDRALDVEVAINNFREELRQIEKYDAPIEGWFYDDGKHRNWREAKTPYEAACAIKDRLHEIMGKTGIFE